MNCVQSRPRTLEVRLERVGSSLPEFYEKPSAGRGTGSREVIH